jgi:hypothetical protein
VPETGLGQDGGVYPVGHFTEFFADLEDVGDGGAQIVPNDVEVHAGLGCGLRAQGERDEPLL